MCGDRNDILFSAQKTPCTCIPCNGYQCSQCPECWLANCPVIVEKGELESSSLADFLDSQVLKVTVGDTAAGVQRVYTLHSELLRRYSPYFAGLLIFPGTEASTKGVTLDMEVDNVEAFEAVICYMYGNLPAYVHIKSELEGIFPLTLHVKTYLLADRLCMRPLKQHAVQEASKHIFTCEWWGGARKKFSPEPQGHATPLFLEYMVEIVHLVYRNTFEPGLITGAKENTEDRKEPMRKLISWYCAYYLASYAKDSTFLELVVTEPDFIKDVLMENAAKRTLTRDGRLSAQLTDDAASDAPSSWSQEFD